MGPVFTLKCPWDRILSPKLVTWGSRNQNRCWTKARVRWTPGWQATREVCPHLSTVDLAGEGTKSRPGGHPSETGWPWRASCTSCSTRHRTTPTTQEGARMVSLADSHFWTQDNRCEWSRNGPGTTPSEPGVSWGGEQSVGMTGSCGLSTKWRVDVLSPTRAAITVMPAPQPTVLSYPHHNFSWGRRSDRRKRHKDGACCPQAGAGRGWTQPRNPTHQPRPQNAFSPV